MGAIGKVIKADVALHVVKVGAAALGLVAAAKGLKAALSAATGKKSGGAKKS